MFIEERMLQPDWLKKEKVQAKDDKRTIVQAKLGELTISSKELNEVVSPQLIPRESSSRTDHQNSSLDTYMLARDRKGQLQKHRFDWI